MSSEMFFGRDLSPLQERFLSRIAAPVRIVVYLRRFDDFIEADYKQRAKNGLPTGGAAAFVADRLAKIAADPDCMNLENAFARIRAQMPGAGIIPRLYLREEMAGHDITTDFLSLFGVPPEDVPRPERAEINAAFETRNAGLRAALFPERERLFPPAVPGEARPRGRAGELAEFQHAVRMILRLARG